MADIVSGNFSIPSGALSNAIPADGSITTAKLANDAVTAAKLANDSVHTVNIADDAVVAAAIADDAVTADAIADGAVPDATSSGTIVPWGGTTAPTGWLECDGAAVSRTTYADLFTAIGTTYGSGDGSTTFNVPDVRGRTVCGKDNMGGTAANRLTSGSTIDGSTLGTAGGAQTHTLSSGEMPSHGHNIKGGSGAVPDWFGGSSAAYGMRSNSESGSTYGSFMSNNGSSNAHTNVQPSIVLNYIIKT